MALGEADPDALLEWLSIGQDDQRDMQFMAVEHICMALLMSDNVDRCFELYPPKTFIPPLCMIILDDSAPDALLEATARALTYYLDVSAECTRRISNTEGTVRAICNRLLIASLENQTGKDLAEQCIKVLEHMSSRDLGALLEAGALNAVLAFIRNYGFAVHKDALRSAMTVVSRLCSKIESTDTNMNCIVESLTALLRQKDAQVSDSALRCFISLAERFTRRNADTTILTIYGLVELLLHRLIHVTKSARISLSSSTEAGSSSVIPNVLSLLQVLTRSSPPLLQNLCRSQELVAAVASGLEGDDRCIMEVIRWVDMLITILFEGRHSLLKQTQSVPGRCALRRLESVAGGSDRSNRHLIETIRGKDYESLVEAVENGSVDVNTTDDVGQSLLNWASAFGTQEMVEFLCAHGADPNKGQRSSSLHYAACFGRPGIAKVLLQHGADPGVKDEDGKTAMEKAKERSEEGHREIVKYLSAPEQWITADKKENGGEEQPIARETGNIGENSVAGAEVSVKLIPLLTHTAVSTLSGFVRRSCACLIKKMLHCLPKEAFGELTARGQNSRDGFMDSIVKLVAMLLCSDEDDESLVLGLSVTDVLITKSCESFFDGLFRAGVVAQIAAIATDREGKELGLLSSKPDNVQPTSLTLHRFGDWCLIESTDAIYMWSPYMIMEFRSCSLESFRVYMNGEMSVICGTSNPEKASDGSGTMSPDSSTEFLYAFLQLITSTKISGSGTISPLSVANPIRSGNWLLTCVDPRMVSVVNTERKDEVQLRHNITDTIVMTPSGEAAIALISHCKITTANGEEPDLSLPSGEKAKINTRKFKAGKFAQELYSKHFQQAQPVPRGPMGKLIAVIAQLEMALQKQEVQDVKKVPNNKSWSEDFRVGIRDLINVIGDGSNLSSYEIQSTNLIKLLGCILEEGHAADHLRAARVEIWKAVFHQAETAARPGKSPADTLVQTIVSVLECTEKLPVQAFDVSAPGSGFLALTRPITTKLEIRGSTAKFVDRTGRKLRIEPLVTIREVENYLWKKVFKNWYDYDRTLLAFVKKINELDSHCSLTFSYSSDFDDNGIIFWIGTNAKTVKEWINPATMGMVAVSSSDGKVLPCGSVSDFFNHSALPAYVRTSDAKEAWFAVDFGLWIEPTHYTLRHGRGSGALRSWLFQASGDGTLWYTLMSHVNDNSLVGAGSTNTWRLDDVFDGKAWRYFRVQMSGKNSEKESCLCLSGFELYGRVTGVCNEIGKASKNKPVRRIRHETRSSENSLETRPRVRRGRDWMWGNQDGEPHSLGTIVGRHADEWVDVVWDNGEGHTYRMGADGKFDLHILTVRELASVMDSTSGSARTLASPVTAGGYSFVVSGANRTSHVVEPTVSTRGSRPVHSRATSSTLSLPETSANFGSSAGGSSQAVSSDQLHRAVEVLPLSIARAEHVSQLNNAFDNPDGVAWRFEARGTSGSVPSSSVVQSEEPTRSLELNEDILPDLSLLRIFQNADRRRPNSGNAELDVLNDNSSEQSTPIGSLLSLTDETSYNFNALNPLSISVPNLSTQASVGTLPQEIRDRLLWGSNRSARVVCGNVADAAPSNENDPGGSSPLSGAQSFPTLSQQEDVPEPLGLLQSTRTRALLRSMRSTSSDSGEFFRAMRFSSVGLDLREALDFTSHDDDTDRGSRDGEDGGFVSLAEFAMRIRGRTERDEYSLEDGSSEEEIPEHSRHRSGWCDDFILKHQFSSLIPNFDPRPGRNNISQTTDLELRLPARGEVEVQLDQKPRDDLRLTLSFRDRNNNEVYACDPDETIISVLYKLSASGDAPTKNARSRKLWDSSVTLLYGEKISVKPGARTSCDHGSVFPSCCPANPDFLYQTLNVLKSMSEISLPPRKDGDSSHIDPPPVNFVVDPLAFASQKITSKIMTQLGDVITLASSTLPVWCDIMMTKYPRIFAYDTRRLYFTATAFGSERTIVWLQSQREQGSEGTRNVRLEGLFHDFRVGRQKHTRVKVARQHILDWAMTVMFAQGHSKAILEAEFENEEGTGLGPTLEFYALIAAELRRKDLGMWICDDDGDLRGHEIDLGSGRKPAGYYVKSSTGLFPAPYPPGHPALNNLKNLFRFVGITIGRALMDNRLIDLPLSTSFLKLLCGRKNKLSSTTTASGNVVGSRSETECRDYSLYHSASNEQTGRRNKRQQRRLKKASLRGITRFSVAGWYEGILGVENLEEVDPHRYRFIRSLLNLVRRKQLIEDDEMLGEEQKREKLKTLMLELHTQNDKIEHIRLEDLGLTFEFSPSSRVYKYVSCDLISDGDTVPVTIENVDVYVELTLDFCFNSGIRVQMDALKEGIEQVLPLKKLCTFFPDELQSILCGDQAPNWTRDDLLAFTEPKLGYTNESPTFLRFVSVLVGLNGEERKAFVQFVTGCPSLPPGGLGNLHPKLTIVRKVGRYEDEGYPSVNTCVHYLKLPEYSSEDILYQRLMAATKERGFHFN